MIGAQVSRYRILSRIGEGGMGEVFLAHDPALDRNVALKFLPVAQAGDPDSLKRLLNEAQAAARLDHPFVCKVYEVVENGSATADSSTNRNVALDQAHLQQARGEIALADGRAAEAARLLEAALVSQFDADTLESLAAALLAAGKLDEAAKRYEELIAKRPLGHEAQEHWFRAHVTLGGIYERLGRPADARGLYDSLLDLWKAGDADLAALKEAKTRVLAR